MGLARVVFKRSTGVMLNWRHLGRQATDGSRVTVVLFIGLLVMFGAPNITISAQEPQEKRENLRLRAEAGDAEAAFELGLDCYFQKNSEESLKEARFWFRQAAEAGEPKAMGMYGEFLLFGRGGEQDVSAGRAWLERSWNAGHAGAGMLLGWLLLYGGPEIRDQEKGIEYLRQAADMGHDGALLELGRAYMRGRGVPANEELALGLLRKLAGKGDPAAQWEVAWYLEREAEGTCPPKEAIELYRAAAESGSLPSAEAMGDAYLRGCHVEKNPKLAREWYARAENDGEARYKLAQLYEQGLGGAKDLERAFQLYRQYARPESDLAVARMKARGIGTPQDRVEAYAWLHYVELYSGFADVDLKKELEAELTSSELLAAKRQAVKWYHEGGPERKETASGHGE